MIGLDILLGASFFLHPWNPMTYWQVVRVVTGSLFLQNNLADVNLPQGLICLGISSVLVTGYHVYSLLSSQEV
ncbi:hypothetical protein HO965_04550 [Streptococcus suis]|nr:hypothetical protein [Streptococcus suis]WNF84217.1 hypothetical protein RJW52_11055 [Streptococcus suis]